MILNFPIVCAVIREKDIKRSLIRRIADDHDDDVVDDGVFILIKT